jgi:hypothetical protein
MTQAATTTRAPRISEMPRIEQAPWGSKQRGTWFRAADEQAHELANEGVDIDDPCTCGVDFMGHVNGRCPA